MCDFGKWGLRTYFLMGVMVGLLFRCHAFSKLANFPVPPPTPMSPLLYVAGSTELSCGLLVAVGLFTQLGAFIGSGLMAGANFMTHVPLGFSPIAR
jgi:uncharacterized membrane protein YphA (DoxX/SURF4 family)